MNFYEIITYVYADAWEKEQFALGDANNGQGIFITSWSVPNIPQPSHEEIMAMYTPELEQAYKLNQFINNGMPLIENYIDAIAKERQYDSALSCASYSNSTNLQWKSEAGAFIVWRDSVFSYTIEQIALMEAGERTIPTFAEFKNELPTIAWPN